MSLTTLPFNLPDYPAISLVMILVFSLIASQIIFKLTYLLPRLLFKPQATQIRVLLRPLRHVFKPGTRWHQKSYLLQRLIFWQKSLQPLNDQRARQLKRIEIISLLIPLLSMLIFNDLTSTLVATVLGWWLLLSAEIDQEHKLLLDSLTLPLVWLGLLANIMFEWVTLEQAVLGAAFGYLLLWIVYQLHFAITKREGMGYGDFKLTAALGAWVGLQNLPLILIIAAMIALFISLWQRWRYNGQLNCMMPFGPSLAMAGWVIILLVMLAT
ncbi:A24 family peptidase [Thiomicrospira sp. ALE5]|uniref:prepilin peptidase n=1 Tax=Thiomicrospira sp. ALE5 TaxID=748650 RepID=UPI0008E1A137|nr:A24 family peptidase [Thiomicrospira sp. ALE5]SFR51211.1 leader peptidase (prepilin peptidase) / N-methyltransferase [Thiomicrospira sp. ALE5]